MIENIENTIVAISTPPGKGGISVIRLSGKNSIDIVSKIFKGQKDIKNATPWKAVFGKIVDNEIEIDEVIAIVYKNPNSYTKEDMVEINCHGGRYISQKILEIVIQNGAQLAQPGEFTFRAFINGRIDLSQAESVADLINAQTEASRRASYFQLEGKLSTKITDVRNRLIDYCSLLELELDFPEEDIEFVDRTDFILKLKKGKEELENLISTYQIGRIAREGVKLVIVGRPNTGKSSLLNALIREDRAIVTDIPGTTRDSLEVQLDIKGILFRVFDTAGLKKANNIIEQEGIRRSRGHIESADIIVHVFDGSQIIRNGDYEIIDMIEQLNNRKVIRVINKIDLTQRIEKEKINFNKNPLLSISAMYGDGIDLLEEQLYKSVLNDKGNIFSDEVIVTNVRHWQILKKTLESLNKAIKETEKGISSEFVALYIRDALDYLAQITGKVTSEDILNNIFSNFCIGK